MEEIGILYDFIQNGVSILSPIEYIISFCNKHSTVYYHIDQQNISRHIEFSK